MDEKNYVRSLADRVYEISASGEMERRRNLWSDHNSLVLTPPPIYVRAYAAAEIPELRDLKCESAQMRGMERHFLDILYRYSLEDDSIFEPWYTVRAAFSYPKDGKWGFPISVTRPENTGGKPGAFIFNPPIKKDEDIGKFVKPVHSIDEAKTNEIFEKTSEILQGIMPVAVDRSPVYTHWNADISTDLAYIVGLEGMMWAMADRPGWLHKITGFMGAGVAEVQNTAEAAGDFSLFSQENQAMPYSNELPRPSLAPASVTRSQLWAFCASQETAVVSPEMWEEFILNYQKPVYGRYGLLSYGCCEDMTRKFPILKRELKNLRRVAVTPWANLRECSQLLGSGYVLSWRPSPTDMAAVDFDAKRVKKAAREAFGLAGENKNHIDVTLKDVETVSGNLDAVKNFVKAVREVIGEGKWMWK
ncbi:MAG: hypothetical protein FWD23_01065 [Oscillospiraceae bacterium]|nr:hypothetical protein [Oscillospiraceae bacterium]